MDGLGLDITQKEYEELVYNTLGTWDEYGGDEDIAITILKMLLNKQISFEFFLTDVIDDCLICDKYFSITIMRKLLEYKEYITSQDLEKTNQKIIKVLNFHYDNAECYIKWLKGE